jgi:hypothetical protein
LWSLGEFCFVSCCFGFCGSGVGGAYERGLNSGHYDSRNTDVMNRVDDAPGADDE